MTTTSTVLFCDVDEVRDDSDVVKCGMKALSEVVDESLNVIRKRMVSDAVRLTGVENCLRRGGGIRGWRSLRFWQRG